MPVRGMRALLLRKLYYGKSKEEPPVSSALLAINIQLHNTHGHNRHLMLFRGITGMAKDLQETIGRHESAAV